MKEIYFSPYQLTPKKSLNAKVQAAPRHGALLMVRWTDGLAGFADLHPWAELGDQDLKQQLDLLKEGRLTALSHSSLWLARRDAESRFAEKNFLPVQTDLKNNALLSSVLEIDDDRLNSLKLQGFDTIKLKLGRDLKQELHQLHYFKNTSFRLRFDFNNLLDENSYVQFMSSLPEDVRARVEYVEDPFRYNHQEWSRVRSWAPLALDQELARAMSQAEACFDVVILKPAKTDVAEALHFAQKYGCKVTITSYMDHPVGIMHAAALAYEMKKEYGDFILQSGCLTHDLYEENAFSAQMKITGPFLHATAGEGVGFDSLLEALPWQPLTRL